MSTPEAVAWLREQITARLETAKGAHPGPWDLETWNGGFGPSACVLVPLPGHQGARTGLTRYEPLGTQDAATAAHIAFNDPQDVIARCEAELAIVDLCVTETWGTGGRPLALRILVNVASGYRHRPGYTEHWGSALTPTASPGCP